MQKLFENDLPKLSIVSSLSRVVEKSTSGVRMGKEWSSSQRSERGLRLSPFCTTRLITAVVLLEKWSFTGRDSSIPSISDLKQMTK